MKAFLSVFRMRWRMELQYRAAAFGGIVTQVFFGLVLVALYRALYAGHPQALPISSVTTYVWLQQAFFRMLFSSDEELADKIRTGSIAYDLCRPLHLYGYYYARIAAQKLLGSIMRAVPMLLFAALLPRGWGISPPASPAGLLLACAGLLLGLLCVCALENISVGITMRTLDPRGIQGMLTMVMMTLSGNLLPLTLFPDSWQRPVTLLPYAQLLDAPIRLYTGEWTAAQAPAALLTQGAWTLALLIAGLLLWRRSCRRLTVQGG